MEKCTMRILVIDDEYDMHTMLRSELDTVMKGYQTKAEVILTTSVQEAFRHFAHKRIHLVAINPALVKLPDDLISDMRQARGMPILILTQDFNAGNRIHYMKQGADMVLPKPVEYEEYRWAVERTLRRSYTSINQLDEVQMTTRYKQLEVNPLNQIIRFEDEIHRVPRKEFEVLRLLMEYPGRILTKEFIYSSVWGNEYGDVDKSVAGVIYRLRKKLGERFNADYLENIYNTGYRFANGLIED